MVVYAVANNKGGVGKTTVAVNLASVFAREGHRTLLVDMDPQGNAGIHLGIEPYALKTTMREVMLGTAELSDVIVPSGVSNLDVAPANLLLDDAEMSGVPGKEMALSVALESVADRYAFAFVDCPPRLGLFTTGALVAARRVILPVQVAHFALEGTSQVLWAIETVQKRFRKPDLEIAHVIPMMFRRTGLALEILAEIQAHFKDRVTMPVPVNVAIDEASANGQPVVLFAPRSTGARVFEEIALEMLAHV